MSQPALVRAIGRWSLTATVVNSVVGSSIFGMPSVIAGLVGPWSPLAVLAAGASVFVVVLCFAEVGSRFDVEGGPYLYAREAFGPAVGFQVGWLHIWARLLSGAAVLNVFVAYLALLLPIVATPAGRTAAMTLAVALVTAINVIGVRQAAWTVNVFTVAKLLPLGLLVVAAAFFFSADLLPTQVVERPRWTDAILLLVFSYGGFESAVVAASETRDPKRDTAFALIVGVLVITGVYCLVQVAIVGVLPHAKSHPAPVAAALEAMLGGAGVVIGSLAAVASTYGWLVGFAQMTPRVLMAMARRCELPAAVGSIHERFRTPYVAIFVNSLVALGLGLGSGFADAATMAAVARLGIFASTCAALLRLRGRADLPSRFVLPWGPAIAATGIAFSVWLITTRSLTQAWMLLAIMALGAILWMSTRASRARLVAATR